MKYSRWAFPPSVQWAPRRWAHPAPRLLHLMARRATLSRHWCKIKNILKKRKKRVEERKRWRRARKPVEVRLLNFGAHQSTNHNLLLPAPKTLRDGLSQKCVGAALEHRGGQASQAKMEGKLTYEGHQENKTAPGQEKGVQDLFLDFLLQSKAVMISCWSLYMNNVGRKKQTNI